MYDLNSRRKIFKLIINLQCLWSFTILLHQPIVSLLIKWRKTRRSCIKIFFQRITVKLVVQMQREYCHTDGFENVPDKVIYGGKNFYPEK